MSAWYPDINFEPSYNVHDDDVYKVDGKTYTSITDREEVTYLKIGDSVLFNLYGTDINGVITDVDYDDEDEEYTTITAKDEYDSYDLETDDIFYINNKSFASNDKSYIDIEMGDYIETLDDISGYVNDINENDETVDYYISGDETTAKNVPEEDITSS